jgi:AraC-like DNA-binding protein
MKSKMIIAVHNNTNFIKTLKAYLVNTFTIVEKQKMQALFQEIRVNPVVCIVVHVDKDNPKPTHFEQFKKRFSHIPCIAVIASSDMELARYCGSIGIESVLPFEKIHSINGEIARICAEKNNRVSIEDLSINKTNPLYSPLISESLLIMERDYPKIFSINEIADLLEINEPTLSREFSKFGLPGPKKILMYLKVNQAIKLMQNQGLNIREISSLSGFTDEKRMAECFHRMFGMPPGEYRIKNVIQSDKHNKEITCMI